MYAGLYNAHRVSCQQCNDKILHYNQQYYIPCTEGMKTLIKDPGIAIKPFSRHTDWLKLADVLNRCIDYEGTEFLYCVINKPVYMYSSIRINVVNQQRHAVNQITPELLFG